MPNTAGYPLPSATSYDHGRERLDLWREANKACREHLQGIDQPDEELPSHSQLTEAEEATLLTEVEEGTPKRGIVRWVGRYLGEDGTTHPFNGYYTGVEETTVLTWLRHCMQHQSRRDTASLLALASCLATELSATLRNEADRGTLLKAIPLTLEPSLSRSRLRLGHPVPGTRQGRTTVQLLPRYSRNHTALLYLRGVLQKMRGQAVCASVRQTLSQADDDLRSKLGVSGALDAERLRHYDPRNDKLLSHPKLKALQRWCQIAEHVIREHTFFQQVVRPSASSLTDLLCEGRIEWFVHLPHLFERYVRRQLAARLSDSDNPSLQGLEVIKPRGVPHKHFPDRMACPDMLVREKASRNAIAIYDAKLYQSTNAKPHANHYHQVESDVLSFNASEVAAGRHGNIAHAGLVYGFWVGESVKVAQWKRGCYHACVRGEEDEVGAALDELVKDLAVAYSRLDVFLLS